MQGANYQRLLNKIFADHIVVLIEVYIDDMLVKTMEDEKLLSSLEIIFSCLHKHKMKLNPHKCTFIVEARKFLGFMLIHRGIEAITDKCQAILEMKDLTSMKVQCLTGRISSLSRFLAASTRKAIPLIVLLKKESNFEWMPECESSIYRIQGASILLVDLA